MKKKIKSIKQLKDIYHESRWFRLGHNYFELYLEGTNIHDIKDVNYSNKDFNLHRNFNNDQLQFWADNGIVEVEYEEEPKSENRVKVTIISTDKEKGEIKYTIEPLDDSMKSFVEFQPFIQVMITALTWYKEERFSDEELRVILNWYDYYTTQGNSEPNDRDVYWHIGKLLSNRRENKS